MRTLSLLALLLVGCDDFEAVQRADTVEAYEDYLERRPGARFAFMAQNRLEELRLEQVRANPSLEAYDDWLARFAESPHRDRVVAERESYLFEWAQDLQTAEAWQRFVDEYPRAERQRRDVANRALRVASYREHLQIGEPEVREINLARDPEGELNGWLITAEVANTGTQTLRHLSFTLAWLDDEGAVIGRRVWPVVAEHWPRPVREERKQPMRPGETRTWEFSTGDVPRNWTGNVRVYPSNLSIAEG